MLTASKNAISYYLSTWTFVNYNSIPRQTKRKRVHKISNLAAQSELRSIRQHMDLCNSYIFDLETMYWDVCPGNMTVRSVSENRIFC